MKLPPDPYADLPTKSRVKLQSYVPEADKDRLMLVIPNRDLYTLLINHALRRTVAFINTNALSYTNPGDADRLLQYIIEGTDSARDGLHQRPAARPAGDPVSRNDTRKSARVRAASKNT